MKNFQAYTHFLRFTLSLYKRPFIGTVVRKEVKKTDLASSYYRRTCATSLTCLPLFTSMTARIHLGMLSARLFICLRGIFSFYFFSWIFYLDFLLTVIQQLFKSILKLLKHDFCTISMT